MPKQPRPEKNYFGKIDIHSLKKIAESKRSKLAKEEMERLKKLHWRRCADCGMELESVPFKGKTVHKCFNCGGVFLEGGTLENLCGEDYHVIESLLDMFGLK